MSDVSIVYPLKDSEIGELQRILNIFDVLHVGITDGGKLIIEYSDTFSKIQVKIINP